MYIDLHCFRDEVSAGVSLVQMRWIAYMYHPLETAILLKKKANARQKNSIKSIMYVLTNS